MKLQFINVDLVKKKKDTKTYKKTKKKGRKGETTNSLKTFELGMPTCAIGSYSNRYTEVGEY